MRRSFSDVVHFPVGVVGANFGLFSAFGNMFQQHVQFCWLKAELLHGEVFLVKSSFFVT